MTKSALIKKAKLVAQAMVPALGALVGDTAMADELSYIDQRNDPVSLVRSYYNALNRHEYARAWSYWGADGKPGQSYDSFVNGFEGTLFVDLYIGNVQSEGAAGSTFHAVPVAINAWQQDGTATAFAGCFFLRIAEPTIQEPPFEGLHLYEANLDHVDEPYFVHVPETCAP